MSGVIALIPGRNDTLRVNGRARLVRDAPWFDDLAVRGKRPILALVVEIEQVFSHCPKAFMRSGLWEPTVAVDRGDAVGRGAVQGGAGHAGDA